MKKMTILLLLLCGFCFAYSQDRYQIMDRLLTRADSLQSELITLQNNFEQRERVLNEKIDSLVNTASVPANRRSLQQQLRTSQRTVANLQDTIAAKGIQLITEFERGRNEVLSALLNHYLYYSFDELISASTPQSVQRSKQLSKQLPDNNEEIGGILAALHSFFDIQALLSKRFDAVKIDSAQVRLGEIAEIARESVQLDELRMLVSEYADVHRRLTGTLETLIEFVRDHSAGEWGGYFRTNQYAEVMRILVSFMRNEYTFIHYSYLANIVTEVMNRKHLNPDNEIEDLLKRLR